MAEYSPGLEGVIAGETAISSISDEGLRYRGYLIGDLVARCSFEEVAFLLLYGDLPNREERDDFCRTLAAARPLAPELADLVRRIPAGAIPMDATRSAVSLAAHHDPDAADDSRAANVRKSVRLLAQVPALLGAWHAARQGRATSAR